MRRILALAFVVACGSDDQNAGSAFFTAAAGGSVESDAPPLLTSDGWTLHFDRFLVTYHDLSVRNGGDTPLASLLGSRVLDLKVTGPKRLVTFDNLPEGSWKNVDYGIAPVAADTEVGAGATEADRQLLLAAKWSVYFEGTATNGSVTKYLRWGLAPTATYACSGIAVKNGQATEIALRYDVTQIFPDFAAFAAADKDGDGIITGDELAAAGLVDRLTTGARAAGKIAGGSCTPG